MELWCEKTLQLIAKKEGLSLPNPFNFQALLACNPNAINRLLTQASHLLNWPIKDWQGPFDNDLLPIAQKIGEKRGILPIKIENQTLWLAPLNPFNESNLKEIAFIMNQPIQWVLINPFTLASIAADIYETHASLSPNAIEFSLPILDSCESTDLMNWINHLLNEAIQKEASDIHIEHNSLHFSIKLRLKGQLHAVPTPKKHIAPYILNHIKQLAHLDISECYLPQDGRFTYPYYERQIYFRVALIPVYEGESLVLRILNAQQLKRKLNDLNIIPQNIEELRHLIRQPHGLILITGPTGSGKTTTAYALIHEILTPEIKLITVEDPIEYDVPGSIQIPVNEPYGLTFDVILQATLRHDLDVLFVGEIRNQKTAHMALQAALTGHKVIATLHAVDDLGAIPRLSELGIPHYLLKDNLQAIINQQLIADPCTHCNKNGCPTCDYQGIVKRTLHMKIHTPPF